MPPPIDVAIQADSFDMFLESLRDPDLPGPAVSPKRFVEALQIDLQVLAEQAGVHRNTLTRAPSSRAVQDFLRDSIRVIRAATDLSGDIDAALFWYRNEPLSTFAYQTPEQLVAAKRTEDLLRYIVSLGAGAAG